ncbi:MAG: hypothetical protein ACRELY_15835, partial [Polyangiaceae bacterium]
ADRIRLGHHDEAMIDEPESEEEIAARLAKRRKSLRRIAIALAVGTLSWGAFLYVKYGMKKSDLGGACHYAIQCKPAAPRCLRLTADSQGACSRPCDPGSDCAPGIRCVKVGLDEYDDRGVPLEGGYCIPQALIDERKRAMEDAGVIDAGKLDSWLAVPEIANQLEGEVDLASESGETKEYVVKGTLIRAGAATSTAKKRTIADASTLRLFFVDDDKQTFSVVAMGGTPGDVRVDKTGKTDRVADRDCDVWNLVEGRITREACVIPGGAFIDPGAHVAWPWARELAVRGVFPLRVVETDSKGHEMSRITATRLIVHPVDASLFAIPHAYKNLAGARPTNSG